MAIETLFMQLAQMDPKDLKSRPKFKVQPVAKPPEVLTISRCFGELLSKVIADVVVDAQQFTPKSG